jgi:hypothetical protein
VQLAPLLDAETAELKLRTQANLFIGGSILDRGITVPNLISFYYGRNPKRMQADTVLQHSRMYGARDRQDLAVTRFYTSRAVYDRLGQIHQLEQTLREAFEKGAHDGGVIFIQTDSQNRVVPCAPSKISLSDVVAMRPNDFYLPTGFQTITGRAATASLGRLEALLPESIRGTGRFENISLKEALDLIDLVQPTIEIDPGVGFQWEAMASLLKYYSGAANGEAADVLLLVEAGRRLSKAGSGDKSGRSIVGGQEVRALLSSADRIRPALVMLRQEGSKDPLGWKADRPFWWPILAAPANVEPCVFSGAVSD